MRSFGLIIISYNTLSARASKSAASELQAYSNNWLLNGGINSITLYDVDISDGSYQIVASGGLSEIVSFLSRG